MSELYVIMYHYVRSTSKSRYPNIKALDYDDFVRQINFLMNNFSIIRMEDVIRAYYEGYPLPEKALLLTFDDGYIDCWSNVFPLLDREGLQGSFFVSGEAVCGRKLMDVNRIQYILAEGRIEEIRADLDCIIDEYLKNGYDILDKKALFEQYAVANRFDDKETIYVKRLLQKVLPYDVRHEAVCRLFDKYSDVPEDVLVNELYLDMNQVKHMYKSGMHIGIHGYEHIWGGCLSQPEMNKWIDKSLDCLRECIDADNWTMSYPYGSYNDEMIEYIKMKGCKVAFLSQVGRAKVDSNYKYKILRFDTNDFPPKGNGYLSTQILEPY